ncbi:MAG: hypothetical protein ACREEM_37985 [Blastocatellia bacterium]
MTCREVEQILPELASDRSMDAAARKRALVHSAVCKLCGERLATERSLAARLLEFAEATGREHASPRVKQHLRAALTRSRTAPAGQVIPLAPRRSALQPTGWPRWALAAAAVILAFLTITILFWQRLENPANEDLSNRDISVPVTPSLPLPAPPPAVTPKIANAVKAAPAHRAPRRAIPANEQELVSDFVPLTMAADEKAIANGTLVRLEMPREKLIAMGLPLQVETGRQTVNAEVMMGDNGVAYAIRVVR